MASRNDSEVGPTRPAAVRAGQGVGFPFGIVVTITLVTITLVVITLVATACAGGIGGASDGDRADDRSILVFAAASLTDVMAEAEADFEAANPAIDVSINLAGSAALRTQILEGAPADVVATANPAIMDDLVDAGRVTARPTTLASNQLVIAVAPGNPADIGDLQDLADPDRFVGLCASQVPCGDLADRATAAAGVTIEPDTREPDVRSLLAKVETGELDAGLVYRTDVVASDSDIAAIDLPSGLPTTTDYPIATLAESGDPAAAAAFVSFLSGPQGRQILADHGFGLP